MKHSPVVASLFAVAVAVAVAACGGPRECKLDEPTSCAAELACAPIQGRDKPLCVPPLVLEGKVFDLGTSAAIAAAEVSAFDPNGAPVSGVVQTDAQGRYQLRIPATRSDEKGTPLTRKVMLRAVAKNYEPFPQGLRVSLPIDTAGATAAAEGKPWVLSSSLTEVGLLALPAARQGMPAVSGTVELAADQGGALVVLEGNGRVYSTVAGVGGAFKLFNVEPAGGYKAQAYAQGSSYTAVDVTVAAGTDLTGVKLLKSTAPTATLSGTVQLVAGANGAGTSVVMVVESTFNDVLVRGEVPPGLRAPTPGTAPNVTGAFSIAGVPDGRYVVLAAFENDGNVRDPDPNISGTQIARVTVSGGQASASPSFKVTGAVQLLGPGAGDGIDAVAGAVKFSWRPYASARTYDLSVFDARGTKVWDSNGVTDAAKNASGNLEVTYGGPALAVGMVYQWRVLARGNQQNAISTTEELRGLFTLASQ